MKYIQPFSKTSGPEKSHYNFFDTLRERPYIIPLWIFITGLAVFLTVAITITSIKKEKNPENVLQTITPTVTDEPEVKGVTDTENISTPTPTLIATKRNSPTPTRKPFPTLSPTPILPTTSPTSTPTPTLTLSPTPQVSPFEATWQTVFGKRRISATITANKNLSSCVFSATKGGVTKQGSGVVSQKVCIAEINFSNTGCSTLWMKIISSAEEIKEFNKSNCN